MPFRNITKPEQKVTGNINDNDVESIILDNLKIECCKGNYILVIGSEAILTKKERVCINENNEEERTDPHVLEAEGDSKKLFFKLANDSLGRERAEDFNQLSQQRDLYCRVREIIKSGDWETKDSEGTRLVVSCEFEQSLLRLLNTKCFRIVLTTAVDPYLEYAMEKVWGPKGKGFRVLSIYGEERDIRSNEILNDEFNEVMPTLYYVFGKADVKNSNSKFVLTENDAMEAIKTWFSSNRPKELLRYICGSDKKVLTVGCNFDDWLFRFFWFVLRGNVDNLRNGQVYMEFPDEKLERYLSAQNVGLLQNSQGISIFQDARGFMNQTAERIEDAMKELPRMIGGIFISYAHEDKQTVYHLTKGLESAGFNVWMDEKLTPGDDYEKRIKKAIGKCKIFMPILSSQVKQDLANERFERYYIKDEWTLADERYTNEPEGSMIVFPVVIGDYNVRESYHQNAKSCIKKVTCCDLTTNTFESLKNEIINKLH